MDQQNRKRLTAAIIVQGLLFLLEILALAGRWKMSHDIYLYYTENSNALTLLTAGLFTVFGLIALIKNKPMPHWIVLLRYMSAVCMTLTFLVVVFLLAPSVALMPMDGAPVGLWGGLKIMLGGVMFFEHFLCPIFSLLSFCLLENRDKLTRTDTGIALIPTGLYAAVFITLNLLRVVEGPYFFLMVHRQPWYMSCVWFVVVLGMALCVAIGIKAWANRLTKTLRNDA